MHNKELKMRLRSILNRVWKDVKNNGVCIVIVALCLIIINYIFGTVCPVALIFGVPCPGCGMTRAAAALLHGQPGQAMSYNAAIYVWIMYVVYWFTDRYIFENKRKKLSTALLIIVCLVTITYYVYRICMGTLVDVEVTFCRNYSKICVIKKYFYAYVGVK